MQRFIEGLSWKSSAIVSGAMAYIVAFDPNCGDGITAQTANTLNYLDELLAKTGSSKEQMLQVTVYLSDISHKVEMDKVWSEWIGGPENWPQRACVGVDLDPGYLIEIVIIAATNDKS